MFFGLMTLCLLVPFPAPAQSLDWLDSEEEALSLGQATGRPLLVVFTTGDTLKQTEALWSPWPRFTEALARTVVPLKTKLTGWVPLRPGEQVLALWFPGAPGELQKWKELPSVLELSRSLGLPPPYTLPIRSFLSAQSFWQRQGDGPFWSRVTSQGSGILENQPETYQEEGPAGEMVILKELVGPRKVALPFKDGWSYQSDGQSQTWSPLEEGKSTP